MGLIFNSIKWFNETRNDTGFASNLTDFTINFKANAGEKVKLFLEVTYEKIFKISPTTTGGSLRVDTGGATDTIIFEGVSLINQDFRLGDAFEIYDNKTNAVKVDGVIDVINHDREGGVYVGTYIAYTGTTTQPQPEMDYDDVEIRLKTELKNFNFDWKTEAEVSGVRSEFNQFNTIQRYINAVPVGDGVPRSTAFVTFVPREPSQWDTGVFRMRYVDNPTTTIQRFEIEHEFIVSPFHLQNYVYDPLTRPNEYQNGTLAYLFDLFNIEPEFVEKRLLGSTNIVGSVGWFNENFDGGVNGYALSSISYFDVTNGTNLEQINTLVTTRVTAVITGALFTASEPVVVYHTKAPTEAQYQDALSEYPALWINEPLRNTIGAGSVSGTIINNLSINLDSPTQITVTFDLIYSGSEAIVQGEDYLLYIAVEDSTLTSENSNRVNLLMDSNTYLKSTDEADLFEVTKFEVYTHYKDLDVDIPNTDYEGYNEDGVLIDAEFRIKSWNQTTDSLNDIETFRLSLVGYNTVLDQYFNIKQYSINSGGSALDGTYLYHDHWKTSRETYLLAPGDQFQLKEVEYVSNDGTYATYRMKFGVKINWQERLRLSENFAGGRAENDFTEEFNGGEIGIYALNIFKDTSQVHNGFNKITSNYSGVGDWITRFAFTVDVDNENSNAQTRFFTFSPEFKVYDYDTNSTYTGDTKVFDSNDEDLGSALLVGEQMKIEVTFDDGEVKTDIADFEGIIRFYRWNQTGVEIHELSTLRDTYDGNVLLGYGAGGTKAEKSINGSDQYVITCLLDGSNLLTDEGISYRIVGRLYDLDLPFDPITDANLSAWYDASGLITNTDNAYGTVSALDEVSVWKDLRGNTGFDLIQGTLSAQPILDEVNGKLDFSVGSDFLYWLDNDLGTQYTIFIVLDAVSGGGDQSIIAYNEGSGGTTFQEMIRMADQFNVTETMVSYDGGVSVATTEGAGRLAGKVVVQGSFNHGGDWYLKVNDTRYDVPDANQNSPAITTTNVFSVGGVVSRSGTPVVTPVDLRDGKFHEIMIFANQDVSSFETKVHDYLKAKWGI